jgi:predicted  nucleic acid-binding Zn-ribbon protein
MSFGSTDNVHESGDPDYLSPEEMQALTRAERATVQGVHNEMEILKQKMEHLYERLDRMTKLYMTLQGEFADYKVQRIKELQLKVQGGSTTPEDWDGTND